MSRWPRERGEKEVSAVQWGQGYDDVAGGSKRSLIINFPR